MKIILTILLFTSISGYSQTTWVSRNDSLFMKRGNDSIYYNQYTFFDYFLRIKSETISAANLKTVNGSSIIGSGDIAVSGGLSSSGNGALLTGLTAAQVGLGNVTNESKATMFTNPTFTGTPAGIGLPVFGRVTGSNATTTGQVLVDITGLTVALVANAVYEIKANLTGSTTAVTTGTQYGVQYSAAGATVEAIIYGSSTSTATKTERITTLNTASTAYLTTSAQTGGVMITGIVTTGVNPGNLTIKHLKVTSGTSTVFINSFLKVTRIL